MEESEEGCPVLLCWAGQDTIPSSLSAGCPRKKESRMMFRIRRLRSLATAIFIALLACVPLGRAQGPISAGNPAPLNTNR